MKKNSKPLNLNLVEQFISSRYGHAMKPSFRQVSGRKGTSPLKPFHSPDVLSDFPRFLSDCKARSFAVGSSVDSCMTGSDFDWLLFAA